VTVYIIAQLNFVDKSRYNTYKARFPDVLRKFKGTLLVADEHPVIMEGDWHRDKIVIMSFPDQAAAEEFSTSRDYEDIAHDRKAGANAVVIMARGLY
jgi:uncharacterized protein (DUF1330 family)